MIIKLAILFSQMLNVVFLRGDPDMTVSSRCYLQRNQKHWKTAYKFFNKLFFFNDNHCKSSFDADLKYARRILNEYKNTIHS